MKSIKVILTGIIFILSSLFFMGICIVNIKQGGPEKIALALFVIGILISIIGVFFVKDEDK